MKKAIFSVLIGISVISFISSSVYADGSVSGTAGIKMENANVPGAKGFTIEKSSIIAGNYDVNESTTTTTSSKRGRDGAACSDNDECKSGVCEGGSCCTDYGASCDSSSHCCGHQSCNKNNTCPQ